tara:strand:- start:755 stop:1711 length:957 start_codon:yes stop_codon:yes gene_type:complete
MKIFFISILISQSFLQLFFPILKKYFPDKPNKRTSHYVIKPRSGGIIFPLVFSLMALSTHQLIILPFLILSIIALIDDKYNLPSLFRFFSQLTALLILLLYDNVLFEYIFNIYDPIIFKIIIFFGYLFFASGIINFINFMDGIDGLVSGCMLVILCTSFYLFNLSWLIPIIASLIVFIFWNWEPSKLFMGDVGSYFLGIVFVAILIQCNNLQDAFSLIIISSPLTGDALSCIIRRFINNQNVFKPHKLHLYQRLHQAGWSHANISFIYIVSTIFLALVYIFYGFSALSFLFIVIFLLGIFVDHKYALGFKESLADRTI